MRLVDKIKTVVIGVATTILTSCGMKKNDVEIVERGSASHAFVVGSGTTKGAKRDNDTDFYFVNKHQDSIQWNRDNHDITVEFDKPSKGIGDDSIDVQMREEWRKDLDAAGIPIAKKGKENTDSLLVSVEEDQDGKLTNPVYALNPRVSEQEVADGYPMDRAGNDHMVKKFDASSFGMEKVEKVYERVSRKSKGAADESPVVESDAFVNTGRKYTLNYRKNGYRSKD